MTSFFKEHLQRNKIDLPGFEVSVVGDDTSHLSDSQKYLLEYFDKKTGGNRLAKRSDLVPQELVEHLPNIFLHDIIYDEHNLLTGIKVRLFGTNIVEFYGELTGHTIWKNAESRIEEDFPQSHERAFRTVGLILEARAPIIAIAQEFERDRPYLKLVILRIPFSDDGTNINMAFGHCEWEYCAS